MAENNRPSLFPLGLRRTPHWPFQLGLRTAQLQRIASEAPRLIREDINQAFRGLNPLVVRAAGPQDGPSWLNINVNSGERPLNPLFHPYQSQDTVLNMEAPAPAPDPDPGRTMNDPQENSDPEAVLLDIQQAQPEAQGNGDRETTDVLRNYPEMRAFISIVEKYIPFLFILLMKIVFDHRIGILIILGLFLTFCHANAVVKREVGKQSKKQPSSLAIVTINLLTCIGFVYFVLAEDKLAYALILFPPYSGSINIWEVLWIVTVTDFVLKLMTVLLKVMVTFVPGQAIPYKKKGKYFLFIETTSQLYRTLAPMQHWLYYFSESYYGSSKVFGVLLSAAYLVSKCTDVIRKAKLFRKSFGSLLQSVNYGIMPNQDQIKMAGESCPICQDDYKTPTMLQCHHIFCEDCVSIWFDRERTCPMCRAQIADDPTWRDGSTTFMMQIF